MQQPLLGGGQGRPPMSPMDSSLNFLSLILSVVTAFLGSPFLYDLTDGVVQTIVVEAYGEGVLDFTMFAWKILCYPLVFAVARVGWQWLIGMLSVSAFLRMSPVFG